MTTFISNSDHYSQVVERMQNVKKLLWIGTSDIKDLYVQGEDGGVIPLLGVLSDLVRRGVEVRLIHAKEPGPAFREDFDKYLEQMKNSDEFKKEIAYIFDPNISLAESHRRLCEIYPDCAYM